MIAARSHRPVRLLAVGAIAAITGAVLTAGALAGPEPEVRFVVRTEGAVPTATALRRSGQPQVRTVHAIGRHLAVVTTAGGSADLLAGSRLIAGAAPEQRLHAAGATAPVHPSDTQFARQWALWDASSTQRAGGFSTGAARAWTVTTGSPQVVVAVLDTGDTAHPDLDGATVLPGRDFVTDGDGIDSGDGDGWDDDPTDPGDACADTGEESSWHGTFVEGEIAAQHQGAGVAGIAPGVALLPVRVLGGCGGSEGDTIAAIEWATGGPVDGVPVNAHPAQVVNLSLGSSGGACSAAMQTAIDDAIGRGAVVVAAAGNDGAAIAESSPANCAGVVSVAATTRAGHLAHYSNRGTAAQSPTLAAPGGSDSDPVLGDTWTAGGAAAIGGEEGTSMAAPLVTGAVALLRSVQPDLPAADVVARLTATAARFPSGSTCTAERCGAGIVDAGSLVGAAQRFVVVSAPAVRGAPRVGARLAAHVGTWRPSSASFSYRWLRDGSPIEGATGRAYRLRPADAGHRVAVRVTAVADGFARAAATSASKRIVRAP